MPEYYNLLQCDIDRHLQICGIDDRIAVTLAGYSDVSNLRSNVDLTVTLLSSELSIDWSFVTLSTLIDHFEQLERAPAYLNNTDIYGIDSRLIVVRRINSEVIVRALVACYKQTES